MTLQLDGVTIARGRRTLLRDVQLTFAPGTLTAIVGANGAGKSTLLLTLAGLRAPAAGRVVVDGDDVHALAPRERASRIALVDPTEGVFARVRVADAVAAGRFARHPWWSWTRDDADREAVERALDATALAPLRDRDLGTLSAGERQRVWIALALAQGAPVIALDEPTAHLDLHYAIDILTRLRAIARAGATVIVVLHALEDAAAFADHVIVIGEGRVLTEGTPRGVFTPPILRAAYGAEIDVVPYAGGIAFVRSKPEITAT